MGSIGAEAVAASVASSDLHAKYAETIDRESAYEKLAAKVAAPAPSAPDAPAPAPKEKEEPGFIESAMKNPAMKSFMRSAASALGREITRGLFGNRKR
jgi:hypothetical protein